MRVVVSSSRNVYFNLALEEVLLEQAAADGEPVLSFYVNEGAVVLGRNQNPWREANLPHLRGQGLALARRISGGGTVYHDAGNLNYSIILRRADYQRDRIFAIVLDALSRVGVQAERNGTHSLVAGGRKFSGSAFCFRRDLALHHGTLLVDADLGQLAACLVPTVREIVTKAVASVAAPVVNLSALGPGLDFAQLQTALQESLSAAIGSPVHQVHEREVDAQAIRALAGRNQSWDWVYGETPAFQIPLRAPDGRSLHLSVESGRVCDAGEGCPGREVLLGARWERTEIEGRLAAASTMDQAWWRPFLESLF